MHLTSSFKHIFSLAVIVTTLNSRPSLYSFKYASSATVLVIVLAVKYIIFYPIVLIAQYILLIAISLIVSSISVYIRDLQHLIGVALQLLFYATPIVYSSETIPTEFHWILNINPMTYIINAYRDIFYNQTMIDVGSLLGLILISTIFVVIGYLIFNKLQKGFAEQL